MNIAIAHVDHETTDDVKKLADLTIGKGLVSLEEIIKAVDSDISLVLRDETDGRIIGFSLNEEINMQILSSIYRMCDTTFEDFNVEVSGDMIVNNLGALGIAPQYQCQGYGRMIFQAVIDKLKPKADYISALAWKKGDIIPMQKLLEQAGFKYFGILKSPYKDVSDIYCDYCKSDVCVCDSCFFIWERDITPV